MQAFLNTLAFHGWTGFDVDFSLQRRRELAWDSVSTSVPNTASHNATLLYQGHVQEAKKNMIGNGQHHSDAISVLSEGNWAYSGGNSSPVYQGWWSCKADTLLISILCGTWCLPMLWLACRLLIWSMCFLFGWDHYGTKESAPAVWRQVHFFFFFFLMEKIFILLIKLASVVKLWRHWPGQSKSSLWYILIKYFIIYFLTSVGADSCWVQQWSM